MDIGGLRGIVDFGVFAYFISVTDAGDATRRRDRLAEVVARCIRSGEAGT